jgi:hypothetical protein
MRRLGVRVALAGADTTLRAARKLQALRLIGPRGIAFALHTSSRLTAIAMRQWRRSD